MVCSQGNQSQPEHDRLRDTIQTLKDTVRALRKRTGELEAERRQLQEENRALRQEVTRHRLREGMDKPLETDAAPSTGAATRERLFQVLPARCSYRGFFQVAEAEDIDTATARQCLRHFLEHEMLEREGGQLVKQAFTLSFGDDGPLLLRP